MKRYTKLEAMDKIIGRHDPDFDVRRNGPDITWAEYDLAIAMKTVWEWIEVYQARIEAVETQLAAAEERIEAMESQRPGGSD